MIFLLILLLLSLLLPACGNKTSPTNRYVYDFAESVTLIRHLLKTDSIAKILEGADTQGLERLINNFSPAQMALESEILNCTMPVIVYFYNGLLEDTQLLEQLAQEHVDKVKIITIDAEKFFSIADQFEIEKCPTIVLMQQRLEIERFSNTQLTNVSLIKLVGSKEK